MKKAIWALIIILIIAAGTAFYFFKPASLPVSPEARQSVTELCIMLSQKAFTDTASLPDNIAGCSKLAFERFACEAALRNDKTYMASGRLEKDCAQVALYQAVVESKDKLNCWRLQNAVLKEECLTELS